jgi:hypothetical protein
MQRQHKRIPVISQRTTPCWISTFIFLCAMAPFLSK